MHSSVLNTFCKADRETEDPRHLLWSWFAIYLARIWLTDKHTKSLESVLASTKTILSRRIDFEMCDTQARRAVYKFTGLLTFKIQQQLCCAIQTTYCTWWEQYFELYTNSQASCAVSAIANKFFISGEHIRHSESKKVSNTAKHSEWRKEVGQLSTYSYVVGDKTRVTRRKQVSWANHKAHCFSFYATPQPWQNLKQLTFPSRSL
jgi:hypothetical protein